MPGIAGIVGSASSDECQRMLRTMIDSMRHHESYVSGTQCFPDFGVYAGWVAHPGSFSARQSASGGRGGAVLVFSGECFPDGLSPGAPMQGDSQSGNGDTHHLARAYEAEGSAFVGRLNGLFSGLLIDAPRKRAILFNDRYGMERIYYYEKGGTTYFASEAKALLSVLPELRSFDDQGVAQFLAYGSTLGGRTLFRDVELASRRFALDVWRRRTPSVKSRYFRPEDWEAQPALDEEAFESEFEDLQESSAHAYLSSESRIGISLTGGLDTRMIMACMPESRLQAGLLHVRGTDRRHAGRTIGRARGSGRAVGAPVLANRRRLPLELRDLCRSNGLRHGWMCGGVGCARDLPDSRLRESFLPSG